MKPGCSLFLASLTFSLACFASFCIVANWICSWASVVVARFVKISKMSWKRSMTSTRVAFARLYVWSVRSWLSKMTLSAFVSLTRLASSSTFPAPIW